MILHLKAKILQVRSTSTYTLFIKQPMYSSVIFYLTEGLNLKVHHFFANN